VNRDVVRHQGRHTRFVGEELQPTQTWQTCEQEDPRRSVRWRSKELHLVQQITTYFELASGPGQKMEPATACIYLEVGPWL